MANMEGAVIPILSEQIDTTFVIGTSKVDSTFYRKTPNFSLTNQNGRQITGDFVKGKFFLVDFFFTDCPSICPLVSKQLKRVHHKFKDEERFAILSHSIYPEVDTPEKLRDYAHHLGVENGRWQLLSGNRDTIHNLANFGYHTSVYFDPLKSGEDSLMHSGIVVLVDDNKLIRGLYDGKDSLSVNRLIKDIDVLLTPLPHAGRP